MIMNRIETICNEEGYDVESTDKLCCSRQYDPLRYLPEDSFNKEEELENKIPSWPEYLASRNAVDSIGDQPVLISYLPEGTERELALRMSKKSSLGVCTQA